MGKRTRERGLAEELRQVAQVLRQNGLPKSAIQVSLVAMCGVEVKASATGNGVAAEAVATGEAPA